MQSSEMFLFEKNVLPRSFTLDYSNNFLDLPFLSAWSWSRPPDDRARPESREKTAILDNPRSGVVLPVGIRLVKVGPGVGFAHQFRLGQGKVFTVKSCTANSSLACMYCLAMKSFMSTSRSAWCTSPLTVAVAVADAHGAGGRGPGVAMVPAVVSMDTLKLTSMFWMPVL